MVERDASGARASGEIARWESAYENLSDLVMDCRNGASLVSAYIVSRDASDQRLIWIAGCDGSVVQIGAIRLARTSAILVQRNSYSI